MGVSLHLFPPRNCVHQTRFGCLYCFCFPLKRTYYADFPLFVSNPDSQYWALLQPSSVDEISCSPPVGTVVSHWLPLVKRHFEKQVGVASVLELCA